MNIYALNIVAILVAIISSQIGEGLAHSTLSVLEKLTISRAEINWESEDSEPQRLAVIDLQGIIELPDGKDFHCIDPRAVINLYLGERLVINAPVSFFSKGDQAGLWIANQPNAGDIFMQIAWRSAAFGEYRFRGTFNPTRFALAGNEEPITLTIVLSLGNEMLAQEASVFEKEWDRVGERYWIKRED